jgi:hypothetical protein
MIGWDGHIVYRVDIECDDDEAAKERAKLPVDGHDAVLWDGARKIAEFRRRTARRRTKTVKKAGSSRKRLGRRLGR